MTIPYAATATNNIVAAASPTGQINAIVGAGAETVSVNFTTDDGNAATNLALTTSLGALPSGWSSTATSLSCAIVSSGSGCQLTLDYAPTAAGRGTLTLNYSYTDDSGAPRTGAVNIPYSTTSTNAIVATASPTGQINAIEKTGAQAYRVTFTTNDGKPAANLVGDIGSRRSATRLEQHVDELLVRQREHRQRLSAAPQVRAHDAHPRHGHAHLRL